MAVFRDCRRFSHVVENVLSSWSAGELERSPLLGPTQNHVFVSDSWSFWSEASVLPVYPCSTARHRPAYSYQCPAHFPHAYSGGSPSGAPYSPIIRGGPALFRFVVVRAVSCRLRRTRCCSGRFRTWPKIMLCSRWSRVGWLVPRSLSAAELGRWTYLHNHHVSATIQFCC